MSVSSDLVFSYFNEVIILKLTWVCFCQLLLIDWNTPKNILMNTRKYFPNIYCNFIWQIILSIDVAENKYISILFHCVHVGLVPRVKYNHNNHLYIN